MKYRKKPVVIEAKRLDTTANFEELSKLHQWVTGTKIHGAVVYSAITENKGYPIKTLEGTMLASHGDYIIKGVNGEFYPCKPDIFEKTYEAVEKTDTDLDTDLDGWISVKDSLPPFDTKTIAYPESNSEFHLIDTILYYLDMKDVNLGRSKERYYTHWRPLPKPPQEVSGDKYETL